MILTTKVLNHPENGIKSSNAKNWLVDAEVVRADGLEAENGEDDDAGVDGRGRVADGQDESVFDAIVARRVVTAEGDERAEPDVERIKDLGGRVQPDGRVQ